jgi:hypothetical protein
LFFDSDIQKKNIVLLSSNSNVKLRFGDKDLQIVTAQTNAQFHYYHLPDDGS